MCASTRGFESLSLRHKPQFFAKRVAVFSVLCYNIHTSYLGDCKMLQIWVWRTVSLRLSRIICPLTASRSSPKGGALERRENTCWETRFLWGWRERLSLWESSREAGERAIRREQAPALRRGTPPLNPNLKLLKLLGQKRYEDLPPHGNRRICLGHSSISTVTVPTSVLSSLIMTTR